ncbi:hypothetical protein FQA47_011040 [Oryzias melastigma]|uniref:Uncharacterized protein n=1 Tax=Oryzias melastigma TaxID=30732 RepID=A0A834F3M1_ORYME|nr:hypothetical protein FQA47_011040 [Oryzias melastigma]
MSLEGAERQELNGWSGSALRHEAELQSELDRTAERRKEVFRKVRNLLDLGRFRSEIGRTAVPRHACTGILSTLEVNLKPFFSFMRVSSVWIMTYELWKSSSLNSDS